MCVIFELPVGANIDDNLLDNAVANNWHGYGVVLKDPNIQRLEVRQNYSADKGADPEEIARILKDNDDVIRYVHLRHNTKGENGLENCHPFSVYSSNSRQVFMMHNGTMPFKFCPKGDDKRSDSRIFADGFLSDLLLRFQGDLGTADYNYPIIKTILEEIIGSSNKLLLVSNDLEPLMVNHWNRIKNKDGSEFNASNNLYFDRISRGPRHTVTPFRNTTTTPAATRTGGNLNNAGSGTNAVVPFAGGSRSPVSQGSAALVTEAKEARRVATLSEVETSAADPYEPPTSVLEHLGSSRELFESFGFDSITWLTDQELAEGLKSVSPLNLADLIRNLVTAFNTLSDELDTADQILQDKNAEIEELETKNKAATRMIATLKVQQLTEQRKVG